MKKHFFTILLAFFTTNTYTMRTAKCHKTNTNTLTEERKQRLLDTWGPCCLLPHYFEYAGKEMAKRVLPSIIQFPQFIIDKKWEKTRYSLFFACINFTLMDYIILLKDKVPQETLLKCSNAYYSSLFTTISELLSSNMSITKIQSLVNQDTSIDEEIINNTESAYNELMAYIKSLSQFDSLDKALRFLQEQYSLMNYMVQISQS